VYIIPCDPLRIEVLYFTNWVLLPWIQKLLWQLFELNYYSMLLNIVSSYLHNWLQLLSGRQLLYKLQSPVICCFCRYQWNGIPLIVTDSGMPPCPPSCQYCGSPKVFELQLMAPLVYLLKIRSRIDIEFGTVIVYTCSQSCWQDGSEFREEFIYLQPGPEDSQLTKLSL